MLGDFTLYAPVSLLGTKCRFERNIELQKADSFAVVLVWQAASTAPLQEITGKSNGNRLPTENEWHILRAGTVLAIRFECKLRLASTFSQKPFFTDTGQTIATL